jgi:hypothetical protein
VITLSEVAVELSSDLLDCNEAGLKILELRFLQYRNNAYFTLYVNLRVLAVVKDKLDVRNEEIAMDRSNLVYILCGENILVIDHFACLNCKRFVF